MRQARSNLRRRARRAHHQLRLRSGAEGPAHDPYSWTEYIVSNNDHEICLRHGDGLGYMRLTIDGIDTRGDAKTPDQQCRIQRTFLKMTGFTITTFKRAWDSINQPSDASP